MILSLALLGFTLLFIPNIRIVLLEFDHNLLFIETRYIGLFFLATILIIFFLPIIIPPKREFKTESLRIFCPNCNSKLLFSEFSLKCSNCNYTLNNDDISIPLIDLVSILDLALTGCNYVCFYVQRIGECSIIRKYSDKFNLALPKNCPYRFIVKKK